MSNPDPSAAISVRREHIERRNRRWFANYIPAHEVYCAAARRAARRDDAILHLGGGHDSLGVEASLGGLARRLVCVDPDLNGLRRNRGRLKVGGDGEQLPFRSGLFDLILAENVFEHLPCPRAVLAECRRCLRPGGRLIFLCPNRYGYIYMISAALPYRLHTRFRQWALRVEEADTFPTYYRLNTVRRISATARQVGLRLEAVESYVGWPTYWEFSDLLHRVFVVAHRILELMPPALHLTLIGVLRREL